MKRFARIGGTFLGIGAAFWFLRAIYLYRVWTMASLWYGQPPVAFSFLNCLSPRVHAVTAHGVYADVAFLSLPVDNAETANIQGPLAQSVPLTIPDKSDCRGDAIRYEPHSMPVEYYEPCYRKPRWFATYATRSGKARRSDNDATGGLVVWDDQRKIVYIAAYRTYPRPK